MLAIDKIKDANLTYNQKIQVVGQVMDSLGIDKAEFNKMASKLKGTMENVTEGRAFISAARKAKNEGLKEFEFNGKKYPVTIKD